MMLLAPPDFARTDGGGGAELGQPASEHDARRRSWVGVEQWDVVSGDTGLYNLPWHSLKRPELLCVRCLTKPLPAVRTPLASLKILDRDENLNLISKSRT